MDSMDWFDASTEAANIQAGALNRVLKHGGRVLFRSAALRPWYVDIFEDNGFASQCVAKRTPGSCIDRCVFSGLLTCMHICADPSRVNMYASTWVCTKSHEVMRKPEDEPIVSRISTVGSLEL